MKKLLVVFLFSLMLLSCTPEAVKPVYEMQVNIEIDYAYKAYAVINNEAYDIYNSFTITNNLQYGDSITFVIVAESADSIAINSSVTLNSKIIDRYTYQYIEEKRVEHRFNYKIE